MPKHNKPDDDPNQCSDELLIRLLEQPDNKEEFNKYVDPCHWLREECPLFHPSTIKLI